MADLSFQFGPIKLVGHHLNSAEFVILSVTIVVIYVLSLLVVVHLRGSTIRRLRYL